MKVKICGITNLNDADFAARSGADYLGFIFYPPSKRSITVDKARDIVVQLRRGSACPILVGVFVDETAPRMAEVLDECLLDLAQLSGSEVPSLIGDVSSPIFNRSYKALRPMSWLEAEVEAEWYVPPNPSSWQPSLLIDTYHATLPGGTGKTGDWSMNARLARLIPGLMLAGGLTADNVSSAVNQVRPFAVDVASGVESSPGIKDHELVKAFIKNAKHL